MRCSVASEVRASALAVPLALPSELVADASAALLASGANAGTRDGDGEVDEVDDWDDCRCKLDLCLRDAGGPGCAQPSLASLQQPIRKYHLTSPKLASNC